MVQCFIHNVCVATCLQIRVYCHVMIFFIIVYCLFCSYFCAGPGTTVQGAVVVYSGFSRGQLNTVLHHLCYGTVLLNMHALKLLTVAFFCHTELTCLVCIAFLVVCAVQLLLLTCCSKIHVAARVM